MTASTEADERVPPAIVPNETTYLSVIQAADQLIVFRFNYYVPEPQRVRCVARTPSGERCGNEFRWCGSVNIHIVGTGATVHARISPLPAECLTRQRCPAHLCSDAEDAAAPEWEPFDPGRHAEALNYLVPRWSPKGIWIPPEAFGPMEIGGPVLASGQRSDTHHSLTCPFGDHVPLAEGQAERIEFEGIPDGPPFRKLKEEEDAYWAALVDGHIPELAALLGSAAAPPAEETIPAPPMAAPEPVVMTEECQTGPTALYRYFDADDLLLYIGISDRLRSRTGSHVAGSSWMDFAVRSTIERHPTRTIALEVEEAAIHTEHPLFNHQHNDTPEARRALVEYLVKHDRLDLLVPAVSRG